MNQLSATYTLANETKMDCHILAFVRGDDGEKTRAIISNDEGGRLYDVRVASLTLKDQQKYNKDTTLTRRGKVTDVEAFTGSFCKATIVDLDNNMAWTYTCGLDDTGNWPRDGDTIEIDITVRGGKELTIAWRKV